MRTELKATLRMSWRTYGSVSLDSNYKLKFPVFGDGGKIYRISIEKADGSRQSYVGETKDLSRRFSHYRNPGPSQQTNVYLNELCMAVLLDGGKINVDLAENIWIAINGVEERASLYSKNVRRLFESLALVVGHSEEISTLNR